jgi:hypothetical protein
VKYQRAYDGDDVTGGDDVLRLLRHIHVLVFVLSHTVVAVLMALVLGEALPKVLQQRRDVGSVRI